MAPVALRRVGTTSVGIVLGVVGRRHQFPRNCTVSQLLLSLTVIFPGSEAGTSGAYTKSESSEENDDKFSDSDESEDLASEPEVEQEKPISDGDFVVVKVFGMKETKATITSSRRLLNALKRII